MYCIHPFLFKLYLNLYPLKHGGHCNKHVFVLTVWKKLLGFLFLISFLVGKYDCNKNAVTRFAGLFLHH